MGLDAKYWKKPGIVLCPLGLLPFYLCYYYSIEVTTNPAWTVVNITQMDQWHYISPWYRCQYWRTVKQFTCETWDAVTYQDYFERFHIAYNTRRKEPPPDEYDQIKALLPAMDGCNAAACLCGLAVLGGKLVCLDHTHLWFFIQGGLAAMWVFAVSTASTSWAIAGKWKGRRANYYPWLSLNYVSGCFYGESIIGGCVCMTVGFYLDVGLRLMGYHGGGGGRRKSRHTSPSDDTENQYQEAVMPSERQSPRMEGQRASRKWSADAGGRRVSLLGRLGQGSHVSEQGGERRMSLIDRLRKGSAASKENDGKRGSLMDRRRKGSTGSDGKRRSLLERLRRGGGASKQSGGRRASLRERMRSVKQRFKGAYTESRKPQSVKQFFGNLIKK